jgi:hypothetical protein
MSYPFSFPKFHFGSRRADHIEGSGGSDVIFGFQGNDVISALGGDDYILSDGGNDGIDAGDGNDTVLAGDGNDEIDGVQAATYFPVGAASIRRSIPGARPTTAFPPSPAGPTISLR